MWLVSSAYMAKFCCLGLLLYTKSFEKFFTWESALRRWANENDSHSVYVKLVITNHNIGMIYAIGNNRANISGPFLAYSINHAMQYSTYLA